MNCADTADGIPNYPRSWYFVAPSGLISTGSLKPFSFQLGAREFVAFRTQSGNVSILDGRCCHFNARLRGGQIAGDCIECPLHGWQFRADGGCQRIPSGETPPKWARLQAYPVSERFGQVFFSPWKEIAFDFPDFESSTENSLRASRPIFFDVECPWFMIGANAFDLQHFRTSHDRVLEGEPSISRRGEHGMKISLVLKVVRSSYMDHLVAIFGGDTVNFEVCVYAGNLIFVTSRLKRTLTYGLVSVLPTGPTTCRVVNIVFTRHSSSKLLRRVWDPLNNYLRRLSVKHFVSSDQPRLAGSFPHLSHCAEGDAAMKEFLLWLKSSNAVHEIPEKIAQ